MRRSFRLNAARPAMGISTGIIVNNDYTSTTFYGNKNKKFPVSNGIITCVILFMLIVSSACVIAHKNTASPPVTAPSTPTPSAVQTHWTKSPSPTPLTSNETMAQTPVPAITAVVNISTKKSLQTISDESLRAKIQDSKNKLDQLKDSDKADTIIISGNSLGKCEVKKSRELGYLIDANTGDTFFVKGDYWSIDTGLFTASMKPGHTYVILHTHPKMWTTCYGTGIVNLDSFSINDLAVASNLTERGFHIQKVIAVSDVDYEIYPKVRDDWRTKDEIYAAIDRIERFMEVKFSIYDPNYDRTFYDVDNLMPLLAKELNYTYTANHVVMA